jgi:hypothetical protein
LKQTHEALQVVTQRWEKLFPKDCILAAKKKVYALHTNVEDAEFLSQRILREDDKHLTSNEKLQRREALLLPTILQRLDYHSWVFDIFGGNECMQLYADQLYQKGDLYTADLLMKHVINTYDDPEGKSYTKLARFRQEFAEKAPSVFRRLGFNPSEADATCHVLPRKATSRQVFEQWLKQPGKDLTGKSLLHYMVCIWTSEDDVDWLHGIETPVLRDKINSADIFGCTLLHMACERRGNVLLVKELIRNGADIRLPAFGGLTPLHFAAASGDIEVVGLLLAEVGVAGVVFDDCRRTALFYAASNGHREVVQLLGSLERWSSFDQIR